METMFQDTINTIPTEGNTMTTQQEKCTMTSKQIGSQHFRDSLSDDMREKWDRFISKSKVNESINSTVSDSNKEKTDLTLEVQTTTVISKNPKFNEFKSKLESLVGETKSLTNEIYSKSLRLTYNYIQIGNLLDKSKTELSKDDFESLLRDFDIDTRTAYRYIKLVKNDNVSKLEMDDMRSMINPTMSKLMKMKDLTDDEFKKVLIGDDTPLLGESTNNNKNIYPLSTQIDNETYDTLKVQTKIEIMKYFLDKVNDLETKLKISNSDNELLLFEMISSNNSNFNNEKVS